MSVDDLVGRVLRRIQRLNEKRRTLVFLASDNGYSWGEHELLHKRHPYTPSVSVPLAMRWPGTVAPGTSKNRLVSLVDVTPTILDAADIPPDPDYPLDGHSLFKSRDRRRLLIEYGKDVGAVPEWASTRTKSYQYVEYYSDGGEIVFREYYHLRNDPWQLRNLLGDEDASNNPNVSFLEARLAQDRQCQGTECP